MMTTETRRPPGPCRNPLIYAAIAATLTLGVPALIGMVLLWDIVRWP